jgi:hypothetical protein
MEDKQRLPARFQYRVDGCEVWFLGCLFPGTEYSGSRWCVVFARIGGGVEAVKTDDAGLSREIVDAVEFEWIDSPLTPKQVADDLAERFTDDGQFHQG